MKKLIALLFFIVLAVGISNAYAYDDEITFQNIPWGSSVEEVRAAMINAYGDKKPVLPIYDLTNAYHAGNKILCAEYPLYQRSNRVNIAGYNARVKFGFAFVGNATLDLDNSTTEMAAEQLIYVRFIIEAENEYEAKEDMIRKITDIYGEGTERKNGLVLWEGKNNTAIELGPTSSYPGDALRIWYGKISLDEADYLTPTPVPVNTSASPSNTVDPNNKNGL